MKIIQRTTVYLLLIHLLSLLFGKTNSKIVAETPKEILESKTIVFFWNKLVF